jgi:hypothetical protein
MQFARVFFFPLLAECIELDPLGEIQMRRQPASTGPST